MRYTRDQSRAEIRRLVNDFKANEQLLESQPEAQIEGTFVRPLLEYLNWNVSNEGLRPVEYEFLVQRTDRRGKRPDFVLQLDRRPVLIGDAKPVKFDVHDSRFMNQVYGYGYGTQSLPPARRVDFALLTNFREFVVLDCTLHIADPVALGNLVVLDWTCADYVDNFDLLWDLFERNNMLKALQARDQGKPTGLWSQYLSPKRAKANRIPPDKAFLWQMDNDRTGWRVLLAKDMKRLNPEADGSLITGAVQLLINRLIFAKALSDREIEEDYLATLMQVMDHVGLEEGATNWFEACRGVFNRLNEFYNGSIFAPRRELEEVSVSNRVVRDILRDLQPDRSHFNLAVIPVEILGSIYEHFLSRVVRTTDHRVKVEKKPEVRKAHGVYYTPQYITDYIVQNTVGRLLKRCRTPEDVARLKVLDPACGSGSFLLTAYQALIDWHIAFYSRKPRLTQRDRLAAYNGADGSVRLTANLRGLILKNSIFGVDIDQQAVEVTCLSLSLKMLEDTRRDELSEERTLFRHTILPDLSGNIKCGNSLVGPDFYQGEPENLFDDGKRRVKVNAFDWQAEFPSIMKSGGFDAVIGNPPYGMVTDEKAKDYFETQFETTEGRFDTYELFIEKGLKLCRKGGALSYIVPSPLLTNLYARRLRRYILDKTSVHEITNFGMNVFADPTIHTCIVVLSPGSSTRGNVLVRKQVASIIELDRRHDYSLPQSRLGDNEAAAFDIFVDPQTARILAKVRRKSLPLGKVCYIRQCIKTGNDAELVRSFKKRPGTPWLPTLRGKSISRYATHESDLYLRYGDWLARNWKNKSFYETPKIGVRETGARITATLDLENRYFLSSLYAIYPKSGSEQLRLTYILGVLNSAPATWILKQLALNLTKGAFTKVRTNQLARLPIRMIDFTDSADIARHDSMVSLVERMLKLHKDLPKSRTAPDKTAIERQIAATDRQIDQLVYELYGLMEEEIKIVEGAGK